MENTSCSLWTLTKFVTRFLWLQEIFLYVVTLLKNSQILYVEYELQLEFFD